MLAFALPGALAGVAVLRALPAAALQIAVTLGVAGDARARRRVTSAHVPAWLAGLAAGALTTSTSTNGPPMLLHLLGRGATPEQVRDTLTVCFVGLAAIGAAALFATGDPELPDAALAARARARPCSPATSSAGAVSRDWPRATATSLS